MRGNLAYERLHANLQAMGLSTMERNPDRALELGTKEERSLTEMLDELVQQEVKARHITLTETRLRLAGFPVRKTLDDFDYKAHPSVDRKTLEELATLRFVHNAENVIFLGLVRAPIELHTPGGCPWLHLEPRPALEMGGSGGIALSESWAA